MKKVGLPRTLVKIKYTLLTLSKGQGEAKKPASQVQEQRGSGESHCSAFGLKSSMPLPELEAGNWAQEQKY